MGVDSPAHPAKRRRATDRLIARDETIAGDPKSLQDNRLPMSRPERVTELLIDLTEGRREALHDLVPLIYEELRGLARRRFRAERAGHTLNTTALVHEAYIKLVRVDRVQWKSRSHFFAVAARAMRNILVDHARGRNAAKRGGGRVPASIENIATPDESRSAEILALDAALQRLQQLNERQGLIVEHRFFGGLTIDETAEALQVSPVTVKRDWALARAWLNRELRAALEG